MPEIFTAYKRATAEKLTPDVWRQILDRAIADAVAGDAGSREFLEKVARASW